MEDEDQRLKVPMIRDESGELVEVDWDTALDAAAELIAKCC
jgi:formylmethanofuran dehydrogenase subunit B